MKQEVEHTLERCCEATMTQSVKVLGKQDAVKHRGAQRRLILQNQGHSCIHSANTDLCRAWCWVLGSSRSSLGGRTRDKGVQRTSFPSDAGVTFQVWVLA